MLQLSLLVHMSSLLLLLLLPSMPPKLALPGETDGVRGFLHAPGVLNNVTDGIFSGETPVICVETLPPSIPLLIDSSGAWESKVGSYVRQPWLLTHPPSRARTSERTYQGYFRCWKLFRVSVGLPVFLLAGAGGDSYLRLLLAYITYAWGTNGLTVGTIAGHLAAVKFLHRQERRLELFLCHPWIVDALKGVTRFHAEAGTKPAA